MIQDFLLGIRMLRRSPSFAILAVLCLTLGIGATTAVLSWIEGILLRPFPAVAAQDRLVALGGTAKGVEGYTDVSFPDLQDFERSCRLFDSFIVVGIFRTTASIGERTGTAVGSSWSANYFQALGVHPGLGRGFGPPEGLGRYAHPVTV